MALDVQNFYKYVVVDTCAVWNILSSRMLHQAGISAGCYFSITAFVLYECLHKPRSSKRPSEIKLQERLKTARQAGQFKEYALEVADLQDVDILAQRQNLSKGEIAAIAFAKKTNQAFLTDDQGARKLAATALERSKIQTTPHLLGWLVFTDSISDEGVAVVISEHNEMERPLSVYFDSMHKEALRCRAMDTTRKTTSGTKKSQ